MDGDVAKMEVGGKPGGRVEVRGVSVAVVSLENMVQETGQPSPSRFGSPRNAHSGHGPIQTERRQGASITLEKGTRSGSPPFQNLEVKGSVLGWQRLGQGIGLGDVAEVSRKRFLEVPSEVIRRRKGSVRGPQGQKAIGVHSVNGDRCSLSGRGNLSRKNEGTPSLLPLLPGRRMEPGGAAIEGRYSRFESSSGNPRQKI